VADACYRVCRAVSAAGEAAPRPYRAEDVALAVLTDTGHGPVPGGMCRGPAVPDPPARSGPGNDTGAGVGMQITAGVGASRAPGD
jgi:hypothetical protein